MLENQQTDKIIAQLKATGASDVDIQRAQRFGVDGLSGLLNSLMRKREHTRKPRQPEPIFERVPPPEPVPAVPTSEPATAPSNHIKIWTELLIAAQHAQLTGAARVWFVARHLDVDGAGWVSTGALDTALKALEVNQRTRQRWVKQARDVGMLTYHHYNRSGEKVYFYVNLARGAALLGAEKIGSPVIMLAKRLMGAGWRGYVWAGWLSQFEGKPISQATKEEISGISARTQYNYQDGAKLKKTSNYAIHSQVERDAEKYVFGLEDGRVYFVNWHGQLVQKLPDSHQIPLYIAQPARRGRSKKAQAQLHTLSKNAGQGHSVNGRVFCENGKQVKRRLKRLHDNIHQTEVFEKLTDRLSQRRGAVLWAVHV